MITPTVTRSLTSCRCLKFIGTSPGPRWNVTDDGRKTNRELGVRKVLKARGDGMERGTPDGLRPDRAAYIPPSPVLYRVYSYTYTGNNTGTDGTEGRGDLGVKDDLLV
ncbi:hypothetical protein J6590_045273 [Homalodisca vitripennis]|nr:hypothetical protein J6590_045273 [Homalodisca vitripennis]